MPRYYCDYCDTYLTHDSPSVRKQHGAGYKHKANVRSYYQQFEEQQTQQAIDQRIKEHLGLQGGLGLPQVGAAYNQHLAGFPQRPQIPILPTPGLPGNPQAPLIPGMRPQVLARPMVGVPGYGYAPPMQPILGPPGASGPMQFNGLLRPPAMNAPTTMPAGTSIPTSNGNTSMTTPGVYQANPTAPTAGGFDGYNATATPDSQSLAPAASQSEE